MNRTEFNKLGMYESIQVVFTDFSEHVLAFKPLKTVSADLGVVVDGILSAGQRQIAKSGVTEQKREAKIDLASQGEVIAAITHAAAVEAGLTELAGRCNYSFSKIIKGRESSVAQRCNNIHAAASENLPLLADSQVDAKVLRDFKTGIDEFETLKPAPRNKKVKSSSATKSVKSLVRQADSIVARRIDKLMVKFKKTQPDFYNAYKAARVIVDRGAKFGEKKKGKIVAVPSNSDGSKSSTPSSGTKAA